MPMIVNTVCLTLHAGFVEWLHSVSFEEHQVGPPVAWDNRHELFSEDQYRSSFLELEAVVTDAVAGDAVDVEGAAVQRRDSRKSATATSVDRPVALDSLARRFLPYGMEVLQEVLQQATYEDLTPHR